MFNPYYHFKLSSCNILQNDQLLELNPNNEITSVCLDQSWRRGWFLHQKMPHSKNTLNPIPLALVHFCTTPPISYDFSWKYLEIELQKFWLLVFIYEKEFYIFLEFFSMIFMLNKLFCHFVCHLLEVWGSYRWFITRGLICPQPTLD